MAHPIESLGRECENIENSSKLAERDAKEIMEMAKEMVEEMEELREDNKEVAQIIRREGLNHTEPEHTYYAEEEGEEPYNLTKEQSKKLREEVIQITDETAEAGEIESHIETLEGEMEDKISELKKHLKNTHAQLEKIEEKEKDVKDILRRQ
jgi:hypothetical protein